MGRIIVIDGIDGCGKATQTERIYNLLKEQGKKVKKISFPDYDSKSSGPVKMYLNGEIKQNAEELNPYFCSMLYAVDRGIQWYKEIEKWYNEGYIVLCDRYLSANIIYQGAKAKTLKDKRKLFDWIYKTECDYMGIPEEEITVCLTLPLEVSKKLLEKRYNNDESKKDLHEKDMNFLKKSRDNMLYACDYLPTIGHNWISIDCSDGNGEIKPVEEITKIIMETINPYII